MRPGRKRLSMDIPNGIHRRIKEKTKERNCTLTRWILMAIIERLKKEQQYE